MLGYQPQQRAIIIVNNAPVDEVGILLKRVSKNNKVKDYKLQFYLFDVLWLVPFLLLLLLSYPKKENGFEYRYLNGLKVPYF
jgi:hypothetical protein